ncbi:insulinase family protein [Sporolactobacillus sp. THM7-4]|nr:insulinase family protein [Sporolactobacillus sp. THM7-4]
MVYLVEKAKTFGGLDVHAVPINKFKTTTIAIRFKAPLTRENVTKRALLSYALKSATAKSPSTQQLEKRLDDLYGASLSSGLAKKGNEHVLSLLMTVANERFLSDSAPLLKKVLELLAEVVFQPFAKDGAFDAATVEKEKRSLKQRISSIYDDKMSYANQRLIDEMCKQEVYHLHTYGYAEEVDQISPELLYDTYQDMIHRDKVDLYVVGQVDPETVFTEVKAVFPFSGRRAMTEERRQTVSNPESVHVVEEHQAVKQGKLNMGFRTSIVRGDPLYDAYQVFNGLFGVFPHSKLFMNVREKASLAYYASSSYESYKGLMVVMSGIETDNYEKTVNIIKEQLKEMQSGNFSDAELNQTKALIKNAILEGLDSPYSIIDILYQEVLTGVKESVEDKLKRIDKVTRDEIIKAAKQTVLDTIYFLRNEAA